MTNTNPFSSLDSAQNKKLLRVNSQRKLKQLIKTYDTLAEKYDKTVKSVLRSYGIAAWIEWRINYFNPALYLDLVEPFWTISGSVSNLEGNKQVMVTLRFREDKPHQFVIGGIKSTQFSVGLSRSALVNAIIDSHSIKRSANSQPS